MNSIFAKILFDLQNHIMASMPEIRQVDQYLGQDQTDIRPALSLPAVLIDFENTEYEQSGSGSQFALATISVRLCHANFNLYRLFGQPPPKIINKFFSKTLAYIQKTPYLCTTYSIRTVNMTINHL